MVTCVLVNLTVISSFIVTTPISSSMLVRLQLFLSDKTKTIRPRLPIENPIESLISCGTPLRGQFHDRGGSRATPLLRLSFSRDCKIYDVLEFLFIFHCSSPHPFVSSCLLNRRNCVFRSYLFMVSTIRSRIHVDCAL